MEVGRKTRAGQRNGGHQPFGIRPPQGSKGEQAERVRTGRGPEGLTEDLGAAPPPGSRKRHARSPLTHGLTLGGFSSPQTTAAAANDPPDQSSHGQCSLTLRQDACVIHVTSSHVGGVASHILPRTGVSTHSKIFRKRGTPFR